MLSPKPTRAPRFPIEKAKGMASSVMTRETKGKEILDPRSTLKRVVWKPLSSTSAVYLLSSPTHQGGLLDFLDEIAAALAQPEVHPLESQETGLEVAREGAGPASVQTEHRALEPPFLGINPP
jgi:hypothetical protein